MEEVVGEAIGANGEVSFQLMMVEITTSVRASYKQIRMLYTRVGPGSEARM